MVEKTKAEIREKFDQTDYPIHIVGRHVEVTDAMKSYAVDKLVKVERFGVRVTEATITMDIQKLVHSVDFIIHINNTKVKVTGRSENMYASIDQAVARLEAKLRRYTKRLHDHHAKSLAAVDINVHVMGPISPLDEINDLIEEESLRQVEKDFKPHQIVSRETQPLKTLNVEEAIMKMELSEDQFMIYRSEEDQKLKVIYRRKDGNYGVIQPER